MTQSPFQSQWGWTDAIGHAVPARMVEVALPLFEQSDRWIHRRVERISFLDRETIKRQVSVDFTLPTGVTPVGQFEDRDIYIAPLMLLGKDHPRPLRLGRPWHWWAPRRDKYASRLPMSLMSDVTFTDETGKHIPLLTRQQSNQLANAMLQQIAAEVVNESIPKDLREHIAAIALGNRERRKEVLKSIFLEEKVAPNDLRLQLRSSDRFAELACVMATHSPVFCLYVDGPQGRSIAKISYVEAMDEERAPSKGRVRRSIGWKSEYLSVHLNEIGAAASHHIEIDIPEELQVNSVRLIGKKYTLANIDWSELEDDEKDYSVRQVGTAREGSVYMSGLPWARRMGRVAIKMRARRAGFLLGALTVSTIMTIVLGTLALVVPEVLTTQHSDGSIAALLLLPSVVAAYVARPEEHSITSRMLRWARFALVINAALPFLAVLFLLTTPDSATDPGLNLGGLMSQVFDVVAEQNSPTHGLEARWALLAVLSALFTCLFAISNIWPRPHGKSHYRPMPNEESG